MRLARTVCFDEQFRDHRFDDPMIHEVACFILFCDFFHIVKDGEIVILEHLRIRLQGEIFRVEPHGDQLTGSDVLFVVYDSGRNEDKTVIAEIKRFFFGNIVGIGDRSSVFKLFRTVPIMRNSLSADIIDEFIYLMNMRIDMKRLVNKC